MGILVLFLFLYYQIDESLKVLANKQMLIKKVKPLTILGAGCPWIMKKLVSNLT